MGLANQPINLIAGKVFLEGELNNVTETAGVLRGESPLPRKEGR